MYKSIFLLAIVSIFLSSCVSKKKFTALEQELSKTEADLLQTRSDKDDCLEDYASLEDEVSKYKARVSEYDKQVSNYYAKINTLQNESDNKLEMVEDIAAVSKKDKEAMRRTLKNVSPEKLAQAKTLGDSIDLAISHNLTKSFGGESSDVDIDVNKTVVQITISNKLLFRSGSYRVNKDSYNLLEKVANVVKSEPSMEVLVEGHTDSKKVVNDSYLEDNWDLSVRRSTAIVRLLQDKYNVDGKQLIASGRSSFMPISDNESVEGREMNRRTRIIILPNLDKFLAMLEE